MPDAAYGYGMPYFTYYASASTHLAALLKAYGFSYVNALKLTQLLALVVGAGGMYGWLRSTRLTRACSSLASIAYSFAPFHLVNLYIRGDSLAELWAMALYPLVLWAVQRCCERMSFIRAFGLALTVATLICTHNISALNFMPFVAGYLLLNHRARGEYEESGSSVVKPVWWIGVTLIWGVSLAAFFWLPALGETAFVQLSDLTRGYFFYSNHFRSADLVQSSLLFDYDVNPFSMGLAQTVLAAFGLAAMVWRAARRREWTPLNTFAGLGFALSTLMITPLSQPLWEAVPLLAYTQFPWRFLSIQALFTAVLTGFAMQGGRMKAEGGKPNPFILHPSSLILVFIAALLSLSSLRPLRLTFFPLSDEDVTAARLNLYEYFTTAIGNTVNAEYLPQAVKPRPFTSAALLGREPQPKVLSGQAVGRRLGKLGARELWYFEIESDAPATLAIPTHYWPGREAESDDEPVPLRAAPGLGWITFELPPGAHSVTFRMGRTPLRLWAEVFSAFALTIPLAIWIYRRARTAFVRGECEDFLSPASLHPRTFAIVVGVFALGAVVLHVWPQSPIPNSPLNIDFDTLAYPHRDLVRFGEVGELRRVTYSAERLRRGEALIVQTAWTLTRSVEATFRLATPLRNSALPLPFTTVTLTSSQAEAALIISDTLPPGLYFVTVELHDKCCVYPALTADGRTRGLVYLAPVVVDDGSRAAPRPSVADFGALRLVRGTVAFVAGDEFTAQLTWQATTEVPRNYTLALRVRDVVGNEWGSGGDAQPANGFYPTTLWQLGEIVTDTVRLTLNGPGEPPGDYQLAVTVYDVSTLQSLGTATIPFALNRRHPREGRAAQFTLTPTLAIEKVEFPAQVTQGEQLLITNYYLTGAQPNPHYRARWSLDAPTGRLYEAELAPGSPTDRWPLDAWLIGKMRLPIPNDLALGEYALSLQLIDEAGNAVGNAANVGTLNVQGRARDFAVPPVQTAVGATFGGQLKLVGYDSTQTSSELKLQLVWQALAQPRGDYKYFVHLFNPVDEFVATQADAVPRNFTYPTTQWVKEEV
ncbi:MAG: 6-pyruvoyl-tetrahydropterin synthase-related protein, partial [Anaerolineales bacterium]